MITDEQLNTIALTFGFASIILIIIYHAISTNVHKLEDETPSSSFTRTNTTETTVASKKRSNN